MRKLLLILSALVAATYANAAFWVIGSGAVDSVARLAINSHKADLNNPHQTATVDIGAWAPTGSVHYADGAGRLDGGPKSWQTVENGTVTVWRVEGQKAAKVTFSNVGGDYEYEPSVNDLWLWTGNRYEKEQWTLTTSWVVRDEVGRASDQHAAVYGATFTGSGFQLSFELQEPVTNSYSLPTDDQLAASDGAIWTAISNRVTSAGVTNIVAPMIASILAPGCTYNGTGTTLVITGAPPTMAWRAEPATTLAVEVAPNVPRNAWYSLTSTKAPTWPAAFLVSTNSSATAPYLYAVGPDTGTLWRVVGGGR